MGAKKIQLDGTVTIEGAAEFGGTEFLCVCGHCNQHERENATIEFNFREYKIFFYCPECNKTNEVFFGQKAPASLPRVRIGR